MSLYNFLALLFTVAPVLLTAAMPADFYNNTVTGCSYSATCSVSGMEGVCVSISAGCCSGTVTSNLCPGDSDIRCCTNNKCSTPYGSGSCMQTSLCSSKGGKSYAGYCTGPTDLQCCVQGSSSGISRDEIINRAQDWVNRKIPYSQTATTDGYRQDCSGYVSMAWKSSTAGGGHTTYNMQVCFICCTQSSNCFFTLLFVIDQEICTKISKSELKAGDAILNPNSHVLLFHYWIDSDAFMEYAEHGTVSSDCARILYS